MITFDSLKADAEYQALNLGHKLGKWFDYQYWIRGGVSARARCVKCRDEIRITTMENGTLPITGSASCFRCKNE